MSDYQDPYASPQGDFGAPPPKKSGSKMWLIILCVVGGLGVAVCGCCIGGWFFSVGVLTTAVKNSYNDHPQVQQHIGNIDSISTNLEETGATPGGMVFDVEGPNGSGQIIVFDQQGDQFGRAELHVNGDVIDLGPSR